MPARDAAREPTRDSAPPVGEPDLASLAGALRADALSRAEVILPHDSRRVEVQSYLRNETVSDTLPEGFGAIPNKTPYELDGVALYPELLIVRLLEHAGWSAAWRKSWNGEAYWRALREPLDPPDAVISVLDQVSAHAGNAGQWEIVAWRDRQLRLITSHPTGRQPVSAYQAEWLSIALRMGVPISCFAVVEHRVPRPSRRRRLEHVSGD